MISKKIVWKSVVLRLAVAAAATLVSYALMRLSGLLEISEIFTLRWGISIYTAVFYVLLACGVFVGSSLFRPQGGIATSLIAGAAYGLAAAWGSFIVLACLKDGAGTFLNALVVSRGRYGLLVLLIGFSPLFGWLAGILAFSISALIHRFLRGRIVDSLPRVAR